MSRLRMTFMTAAMLLALAALTLNSLAQPPAGGGGGGGGGRGGFGGGRGGFGGPGGGFGGPGGGSLLQLASNPAVQEDLKLKDKQKAQIKSLNDKYNAQTQEMRTQFGMGGPGGPGGPGGAQGKGQGRGGNGGQAGGGGGAGDGGQVQDPDAQAGGGGGRGNRGNRNRNGQGGVPEDPAVVEQRNQQRQMAREAMNELRQTAESTLGKILDKTQVSRLKQISLQLEGNQAILCRNETHPHGDMLDKLQIDEAQVAMMQEVMDEGRNAERATRKSRGEAMKNAFARLNPNGANGGQNNGGNGNGGGGGNANGGGGNNGNGNNGRNGGGRGGRGNFDPEAMRKVMESPEMKAQMDEFQSQEEKLTAQMTNAILKVMSPRQRTTFKKMLGAPFDRSKMFTGGPWGGRGGAAGKNQATTAKGAATADEDEDDDAPKAKPSTAAAPAKAKPSAAAKKKSLREMRGEPSEDN
jgi:hypothetical protein